MKIGSTFLGGLSEPGKSVPTAPVLSQFLKLKVAQNQLLR